VETPTNIQAGFINALEAFRVQHPEVEVGPWGLSA
jgi:hypothetical protein